VYSVIKAALCSQGLSRFYLVAVPLILLLTLNLIDLLEGWEMMKC